MSVSTKKSGYDSYVTKSVDVGMGVNLTCNAGSISTVSWLYISHKTGEQSVIFRNGNIIDKYGLKYKIVILTCNLSVEDTRYYFPVH